MTIMVTGASGLIGSHLCRRLVSEGYPVVGLVHDTVNPRLLGITAAQPLEIERGDITNPYTISEIIRRYNIKTVFHLAAHVPYRNNPDFVGANTVGTRNMLLTCLRSEVKDFIYTSSISVYSSPPCYLPVDENHPTDPKDEYGRTKLYGELACGLMPDQMVTAIVRYSGVYGLGMADRVIAYLVRASLHNEPIPIYGDGNNSADFVYIDDAVEGAILAWRKHKKETYNIGSGQEITIADLAHKIIDLTKSKSEISFTGDSCECSRFVASIHKARTELGYSPHSIDDGLRLYVEAKVKSETEEKKWLIH